MSHHAHWLIRLPFAVSFLGHGIGKLLSPESAAMMKMPTLLFLIVGGAEVLAGLGAVVGGIPAVPRRDLVTRLAGAAAAPVMIGAIAMVHWPQWSFMASEARPAGGMEFQVTLLCIALYFLITGARDAKVSAPRP